MKKYFYFVARFLKQGKDCTCSGIQETSEGYFDIVNSIQYVCKEKGVNYKDVIISFWAETNSVMFGKFSRLSDDD